MEFYKIDCQGSLYIQKVSTLPIWSPSDKSRILYDKNTNDIYIGDNTSWVICSDVSDWNTLLNKPTSLNDINSTEYDKLNNIEDDANNYIHPNHTGDISSVGDGDAIINDDVVTNSKLSNMPANTIKGRESSTGDPQDLISSDARNAIGLGNIAEEDYFISLENPSGGYDGNVWYKLITPPGDRGIFGGGLHSTYRNIIDYVTISSNSNATDFGNLTLCRGGCAGTSNSTNERGIFGGGYYSTYRNVIDYVTISSASNAVDFGDLTQIRYALGACSNGINDRGVFGVGSASSYYRIFDYVTISSNSNATIFGNSVFSGRNLVCATSNGTNDRGIFGGGYINGDAYNYIEYITISSTGNSIDFGDLTLRGAAPSACSNNTNNRGVFGGRNIQGYSNIIDYIIISSTGNAADFGDLTRIQSRLTATSNGINERGIFGGGYVVANHNVIDYVTISSTGNAADFGDLTQGRYDLGACSNA